MRFYTTWRGKLVLASAIVAVSLGVSGCFQTADSTASPGSANQGANDAGTGPTATPTFFQPTIESAPPPVAVAQDATTDPNLIPIDPNGFPTTDPNLAFGNSQFNDQDATSTAIQSTLFAQATTILQGVTLTAAVEQTLTATALGTGAPFDPNAQPQPQLIDPNTGQPIPNQNPQQPATATPIGTPGIAGSGAAGPIDPATCRYTVVQGDRIFRIALRFGLATETLARFNGIVNVDLISVNQILRIPAPGCVLPTTPTPAPTITLTPSETPGPGTATATPGSTSPLSGTTYIVQPGDTLFAISIRTGVRISAIAQANNIQNINLIYVGQTLLIP